MIGSIPAGGGGGPGGGLFVMSTAAPFRCCDLPRCNLFTASCRLGFILIDAAPAPGGAAGVVVAVVGLW